MPFAVNEVVKWEDGVLERILWIDPSKINVVSIRLLDDSAFPRYSSYEEIEAAAKEGRVHRYDDPFDSLSRPEEFFSQNQVRYRNDAWQIIGPLVETNSLDLFDRWKRGPLVAKLAESTGKQKETIYFLLRRYWQRGQMKNALIPDFDHCGAPGKERLASESSPPNSIGQSIDDTNIEKGKGVRVTATIKDKFLKGYKLFVQTREERTFKSAFKSTLKKFFNVRFELKNGVEVPILAPSDKLPTLRQFIYWYYKLIEKKKRIVAREGTRAFDLRHRPVLKDSTSKAFGPGSIYQIDATIGDAYLISSLNFKWIIGRPVIYFVIDVFSRMVVGLYIGLEGPNWIGAMMALANAMTDKLTYCKEHNIPDSDIDWPCHHLCNELVADRGELLSPKANSMVEGLGIKVVNTGSCRGDWKGIVEKYIDIANDEVIHWVPGAVRWPRERGDRDYRLDAVLTLEEFRKLIVLSTIEYNLTHRLDSYPMDKYLIREGVERYPMDLWNHGLRRFGEPRMRRAEIVMLNLLPREKAKVTHHGIKFHNLFYECDLALREDWFVRPVAKDWYVDLAFDPRKPRTTYLPLNKGKELEVCRLTESSKRFAEFDLHEIDDYYAIDRQQKKAAEIRDIQSSAYYETQGEAIVSNALKRADGLFNGESNRTRLKDMRQHRQEQKNKLRESEAFDLTPGVPFERGENVIPLTRKETSDQEVLSRPNYHDVLEQVREGRCDYDQNED
ncbi:MAG TPA: Mu transposase C-terminal domain-containing protein [Blastocatellia bacterium]|nr:Mu transposase C-terminal domain-containing protein [Blastocatellia bacterium]